MGGKETRRNLCGKKDEKPDFELTINFGEETYKASVRGCQKHLQYFWLVFENTFQTDTHWQCHIRTFREKRFTPSTGLLYIAFVFRYQDFLLFL
jgi:hypothetical protein